MPAKTAFQKQVSKLASKNPFCETIIYKQDGSVEFRKGYYFHNGQDEYKWAVRVAEILVANGIACKENVMLRTDKWRNRPKLSYFTCTFEPEFTTEAK